MKCYSIILLFFLTAGMYSQLVNPFNTVSLEGAAGLHMPVSERDDAAASDFGGLHHYDLGVRYMFHKNWGARLQYAYDDFETDAGEGIVYNRFTLSMVYNARRLILPLQNRVGLLSHLGVGYATASPHKLLSNEQTATLSIGLTPQLNITRRLAFFIDAVWVLNFRQQYSFTGQLIDPNFDSTTGSFVTLSAGLMFYLGNNRQHADWY